jgi:hypothetical protein
MSQKLFTIYNAAQKIYVFFDSGFVIAPGAFNGGAGKSTDINRDDWSRIRSNWRNYGR